MGIEHYREERSTIKKKDRPRTKPIARVLIALLLIAAVSLAGMIALLRLKPGWHNFGEIAKFNTSEDGCVGEDSDSLY